MKRAKDVPRKLSDLGCWMKLCSALVWATAGQVCAYNIVVLPSMTWIIIRMEETGTQYFGSPEKIGAGLVHGIFLCILGQKTK